MKLDKLEADDMARIIEVQTEENIRKKLSKHGISEGNFIRVISCVGSIVVEADKKVSAIGQDIAKKIKVIEQNQEKCHKEREIYVCPLEKANHLDGRFRKWLQNPNKILKKHVKKGMTVLDIGCGSGFFSAEMAKMVGDSGMVIAADLQEGMLKLLKNKIRGTQIEKRIRLHKCEERKIGISEKVDFALAFYMVHEVPDRKSFFKEILLTLKPNGIFLIVEPKYFHVSKREFEKTVNDAMDVGFIPVEKARIFLSRAIVLYRPPYINAS